MSVVVREFEARASTSSSTVDLTSSGGGTCVAAYINSSRPYTDGGGSTGDVIVSRGFLEVTGDTTAVERVVASFAEGGVATENTDRRGSAAAVGLMLAASSLADYVAFDQRVTDGIRLEANGGSNFTEEYVLDGLLVFGDAGEIEIDVLDWVTATTQDADNDIALSLDGEEPQLVLFASNDERVDDTTRADFRDSFGAAHSDGAGTLTQWGRGHRTRDSQTARDGGQKNSVQYCLPFLALGGELAISQLQVTAVDADEVTLQPKLADGAHIGIAMAFAFKGTIPCFAEGWEGPGGTGDKSYTGAGFKPQCYHIWTGSSNWSNNDSIITGNLGQSHYSGGVDAAGKNHGSGYRLENAASGDVANYGDESVLFVLTHIGGSLWDGDHTDFTATGFDWNITTGVANRKHVGLVLFGEHAVVTAPIGVLEIDDAAPDVLSPPGPGLSALEFGALAPEPVTPATPPLAVLDLVLLAAEPVAPVPAPLGTVEVAAQPLGPVTPASLAALAVVEIDGLGAEPATPPPTLELAAVVLEVLTPEPVAPATMELATLELAGQPVDVVTPPAAPLGALELEPLGTEAVTPVGAPLSGLDLVALALEPVTPISVGLAVVVSELFVPTITTGAGVVSGLPLAVLELAVPGLDPVTPIPAPLGAVEVDPLGADPVTPIDAPLGGLDLAVLGGEPVTPVGAPLAALELLALPLDAVTPIDLLLAALELSEFAPDIDAGVPVVVVVPAGTLEFATWAPSIFGGAGCYERTANSVRARLDSLALGVPVQYDNAPFESPDGSQWIDASIWWRTALYLVTGDSRRFRKRGYLVLTIRSPLTKGDAAGWAKADAIVAGFRLVTDGDIVYGTPSAVRRGRVGSMWVHEVRCPFHVDDVARQPYENTSGSPDLASAASVARTRFRDLVATPEALDVFYDNAPFNPPDASRWVHLAVLPGASAKVSSGGDGGHGYRSAGLMRASIFSPLNVGDQPTLALVDKINVAFRAVVDSGVTFHVPWPERVGRSGSWWQVDVNAPYHSEEIG